MVCFGALDMYRPLLEKEGKLFSNFDHLRTLFHQMPF